MKVSGIICEYNPFHNGHLYHIKKTRENGATHIVAVMSGNFVQRGDVAVINKFDRAKAAVKAGVDLVIELPVAYSLSSAEVFARGAVYLLNALGCVEELSFGSECGHLESLYAAVQSSIACAKLPELREMMEMGTSYPVALKELIRKNYGSAVAGHFDGPNNLLAIEYIKAIVLVNSKIKPFTVQRKSAMHDENSYSGNISSASYIRQCLVEDNDYSELIPIETSDLIRNEKRKGGIANISNLERIILYKLRNMTDEELRGIPDIGQGLENRILSAKGSTSYNELIVAIKTKRYPMARIRRILMCAIIGIQKRDLAQPPPYGRILAINERGCDILAEARDKSTIPFATSLAKLSETGEIAKRYAEIESRSTDIYALATPEIQSAGMDYRAKIGILE